MEDLEVTRQQGSFADEDGSATATTASLGRAGRGWKAGWITLAMVGCVVVGTVAGAAGRTPVQVPGPTVTATVTRVPQPVDTRYGVSTREQLGAQPMIEPGVHVVGKEAAPGTWVGMPLSDGEVCHWQRIRSDSMGRSVIVAEVLTNGRTVVVIEADDNRFVSYGCRWMK